MKLIGDKEKSPYFSAYSVFCLVLCLLSCIFVFARRLTQDCFVRKADSSDMNCTNTTAAEAQIWEGADKPVVVALLKEMLIDSYIPACKELLYAMSIIHSNMPHKSAFSPAFCCSLPRALIYRFGSQQWSGRQHRRFLNQSFSAIR